MGGAMFEPQEYVKPAEAVGTVNIDAAAAVVEAKEAVEAPSVTKVKKPSVVKPEVKKARKLRKAAAKSRG
jgi:hypothetical protein